MGSKHSRPSSNSSRPDRKGAGRSGGRNKSDGSDRNPTSAASSRQPGENQIADREGREASSALQCASATTPPANESISGEVGRIDGDQQISGGEERGALSKPQTATARLVGPNSENVPARRALEAYPAHDVHLSSPPLTPPKEMAPATVPCQYRTGKTLGSGTYAIVKEAVHIKTGKYYACKVINKKLMEGREYMVRNEISVLKKVSKGHPNVVTLHDYFETAHNLYLCFDLCTGGELFDRICAKGNYYEHDAATLVRTIMGAVKYIHECGIVHRDLKPENLLFRTKDENADIMIADFGLSRVMEEQHFSLLTEVCGTPGYMAPEIFKKTGHGKPVDVWAMGVITYFLLCGYTPFDRETQQQEMEAIIAGDYKFEPQEYWANVSETAREFVSECLTIDPVSRPTAAKALEHPWLASAEPYFVPDPEDSSVPTNLLPNLRKAFDAKKTFRKAVLSMIATKRMSTLASARTLSQDIAQYKEESEKEQVDEGRDVIRYDEHPSDDSKSDEEDHAPLVGTFQKMSV